MNLTEVRLFEHFFNWSMSYRNDADIPFYYGSVKRITTKSPSADEILRNQSLKKITRNLTTINNNANVTMNLNTNSSSVVAWMASHCPTHGQREDYIGQLKRYIKVDSYGDCGDLHLCKKSGDSGDSPESCYDLLESHGYKFYLSFENSLCTDYVTEKFFWILTRKMVPVVYGGADYSSIAPPHSYIDARLFEPQELANYLLLLDSNETLYNEYFWWKDYYQVEAGQEQMVKRGFCDLCKKLHLADADKNKGIKIYDQMFNHWLPENQCENPKKYTENGINN